MGSNRQADSSILVTQVLKSPLPKIYESVAAVQRNWQFYSGNAKTSSVCGFFCLPWSAAACQTIPEPPTLLLIKSILIAFEDVNGKGRKPPIVLPDLQFENETATTANRGKKNRLLLLLLLLLSPFFPHEDRAPTQASLCVCIVCLVKLAHFTTNTSTTWCATATSAISSTPRPEPLPPPLLLLFILSLLLFLLRMLGVKEKESRSSSM